MLVLVVVGCWFNWFGSRQGGMNDDDEWHWVLGEWRQISGEKHTTYIHSLHNITLILRIIHNLQLTTLNYELAPFNLSQSLNLSLIVIIITATVMVMVRLKLTSYSTRTTYMARTPIQSKGVLLLLLLVLLYLTAYTYSNSSNLKR